jgi:hypothetical protein
MPSPYSTKLAEAFSQKVIKVLYENAPIEEVINRDYEGEVESGNSIVNILTLARLSEKDYNGSNLSADDLNEVNGQLRITQQKSFYWKVKTLSKFLSYIKNPKGIVSEQTFQERKKNIMKFLMGFWNKAAAGSWIGTDYVTGTVTVTGSTGAVVGSGTTFTAAMVGCPFQATGQTAWYKVATFTDTTHITIVNDTDDDAASNTYTGGDIAGGTAYTIQAATVKTIDNSTANCYFLDMVTTLKQRLDENEVPDEGRYLFIPPAGLTALLKDSKIKLNVPAVYEDLIVKGMVTELEGFKIFKVNRLAGDNVNGYHILAGQRNFITFADKVLETGVEEDLIGNFGSAFKDLFVYGAKVVDER